MCELYMNGASSLRLGPAWVRMRPALRVMGQEGLSKDVTATLLQVPGRRVEFGPSNSNGLGPKIATGNRRAC